MKRSSGLFLFLFSLAIIPTISLSARATELRCGWLDNPTPANWWLVDRDGTWIIGMQGGYQADGMENLPFLDEENYVRTNGYYGYGCACLDVTTDPVDQRILVIEDGEALPLNVCTTDPSLPPR